MHKQTVLKMVIAAAALTLAAGSLASCGGKDKKKAEETPKTVFAVTTTKATKGELKDYLEFGGDIAAKTNVEILPDVSGKIAEIRVKAGDTVQKNEIIALVDPSRPGMNYALGPVKSPISGTITAVNVVAGSMVSPQLAIARVSKIESLEILMNVPERYVSKIRGDQSAYLRLDAYPGEVFAARITEISPVLDQTTRTMSVKLALVKPDARIKAGMFARVKLITDTKSGIVKIPETAVVTRFGETFVFVVEKGESTTVRKQPVTMGIRVDDKAEILKGLMPDDEVVIRGQTLLENGSTVNVVSTVEPLPAMESAK
jgi:multidrug efflux pump subunit AcrA (membrane-fusion protein)